MKQWPVASSGRQVLTGFPAQRFRILAIPEADMFPISPFVVKFDRVDFYCFHQEPCQ